MACPNKNLPEYTELKNAFGEAMATFMWDKFTNAPTIGEIRALIEAAKRDGTSNNNIDKVAQELEGLDKKGISDKVNEFFKLIEIHFKNRLNYSKFSDIREIFKDPLLGSDFKSLFELLKNAALKEEDGVAFEKKVRAFALALQQLKLITSKFSDNLSSRDFQLLSPQEQLSEFGRYSTFLNEYNALINSMKKDFIGAKEVQTLLNDISGNINTSNQALLKLKQSSVIDKIEAILEPTRLIQQQKLNEEVARLEKLIATAKAGGRSFSQYEKAIERVKENYTKTASAREYIVATIEGKRGDTNAASALIEAFITSPDMITYAVQAKTQQAFQNAYDKIRIQALKMESELKGLLKDLNYNPLKPFEFYKQFVQEVKVIYENGEEFVKLQLLNPFSNNWDHHEQTLKNAVDKAKQDGDKDAQLAAQKKLNKFKRDYKYQQYSDVYYDRFELWDETLGDRIDKQKKEAKDKGEVFILSAYQQTADMKTPIGQIAKLERDDIFAKMQDLNDKINKESSQGLELSQEEYDKMDDLIQDLRRLSSTTDINGVYKTGEALELSKLHKEYSEKTRPFVTYKQKPGAFENARNQYKAGLKVELNSDDETNLEFQRRLKIWDENNTKVAYTQDFYEDRKKILDILNGLSAIIKDRTQSTLTKSFSENWDKIFDQLKGYRDESNQVNGMLVNAEKKKIIKQLQEDLEELKRKIETNNGLTPELNEELQGLWDIIKDGRQLSASQQTRKEDLEAQKKKFGLTEEEKEIYDENIAKLMDMQMKVPTEHYLQEINSIIQPLGYNFDSEDVISLLENETTLNKLLKNANFNKWFKENHILVDTWNSKEKRKEKKWQRLYIWNSIIPTDSDKYLQKTTLKDGTVLDRVPSSKYWYRDVNDKFKTGYNETTGKVEPIIGVHKDNRGNWLPKGYTETGRFIAADRKYINEDYYKLKNAPVGSAENKKFRVLEILTKNLLQQQENTSFTDRMWLDVPRFEKTLGEISRTKETKGAKQYFLDRLNVFRPGAQDEEDVNVKPQYTKTDLFGTELTTIPVKGRQKVNIEDVSLDLPRSIMQYSESLAVKKELMEVHPLVQSIKDVLESYGVMDLSKVRKTTNKLLNFMRLKLGLKPIEDVVGNVKKTGVYQRLQNIQNIEERYYKGMYKKGFFGDRTQTSDILEYYLISPLLRFAGFTTLSIDYAGAAVNQTVGNFYSLTHTLSNPAFSLKNWGIAQKKYATKVVPDMVKDLSQELGTKSFYGQLIDLFSPLGQEHEKFGKKLTSNKLLSSGTWVKYALTNPREFGEHQIAVTTMLTLFENYRVEVNGAFVPLEQAYEIVDGILQLKAGAKFTEDQKNHLQIQIDDSIRTTQGNYKKMNSTEAERYVFGRLLFFMRKYLFPLLLDAWSVRRFNGAYGSSAGYNIEAYEALNIMFSGIKEKTNNWDILSDIEKKNLYKAIAFHSSSLVFLGLIFVIYGASGDDKEKWKKTRKWDYASIQLLLQLMRDKSEIEQFTILGGYNNFTQLLNNPFMVTRLLSKFGGMNENILNFLKGDDKADYSDKGGWGVMMESIYGTKNKALISFYKLMGYRGGGLAGQIPGTQESKDAAAYRLKTTASMLKKQ